MNSTGLRAAVIAPCLLLGSCDQALSAKGPATVVTRDDTKDACILLIAVDADSNITVNGESVSFPELEALLKRRAPEDGCEVVVQADKDAMTGTVVKVFDTIDTSPITVKLKKSQQ